MSLLTETVSTVVSSQQSVSYESSVVNLNTSSIVVLNEFILGSQKVTPLYPVVVVTNTGYQLWTSLVSQNFFNTPAIYVPPSLKSALDVAGNKQFWIAVGEQISNQGDVMFLSSDGFSWIVHPAPPVSNIISAIAYHNNLWVCTSQDPTRFYWSEDGISWAPNTVGSYAFTVKVFAITHAQDKWVAVGDSSTATQAYSLDGKLWKAASGVFMDEANAVAGSDTLFVAVGVSNNGDGPNMLVSPDGITWTTPLLPPAHTNGYGVAVNSTGTTWVAAGENGPLYYSYDGLVWTATEFTDFRGVSVCWDGQKFLAYGTVVSPTPPPPPFNVAYSYDGINWLLNTSVITDDPTFFVAKVNKERASLALL